MSPELVSIIVLVAMFVVATMLPVNIGVLAFVAPDAPPSIWLAFVVPTAP